MLSLWKTLIKNKFFYIFAIIIIIMFPSTIYMQSDKDKTIVVTTLGVDKTDDKYNLTILAIIPKGSNDITSNLELFEGDGESISEALDNIALDCGKKIGLAHCDSIIFSMDLLNQNLTLILDYFIRASNLTTNATLIATDGKSKELIEATKSSNNLFDLSLKNIIQYQEEGTTLENVTIEKFYRQYYTKSSTFYLPILSTEKSSNSSNQSGGGNSEESSNEQNESSGDDQLSIKNKSQIAVLRDGKYIRSLDEDEKFIYNLISFSSNIARFEIDNINDEYVNNSKEIYQQIDKFVFPIYKFEENIPVVEYNIWLSVIIDEIVGDNNYHLAAIEGIQNYLTNTAKNELENMIMNKLKTTNIKLNTEKNDILNYYDKFNALKHKKWQEYLNSLENKNDYLENVVMKINLHLNYVI